MKSIRFNSSIKTALFIGIIALVASCAKENIVDDGLNSNREPSIRTLSLRLSENDQANDITEINTNLGSNEVLEASIRLAKGKSVQRRLYISRAVFGRTAERFSTSALKTNDKFTDGSIVLNSLETSIDFTFDLEVPTFDEGNVIYKIWYTDGLGDYRDNAINTVSSIGTINVSLGTGSNQEPLVREFKNVTLNSYDQSGSSLSIYSMFDAIPHNLNESIGFKNLWDFGYSFTNEGNAGFYSTESFIPLFNVSFEGITPKELGMLTFNQMVFRKSSSITSEQYENSTLSSDLESISTPSANTIVNLEINDIIEFEDHYGNKGLIRIKEIEPETNAIIFDIKVQPNRV